MILVPFTASMFSLLTIAIDRYIFITSCLRYPSIVTLKRTKIAICMVWSISFLNALSIGMPWTYPSNSGRIYCTCMIAEASSDLYLILYSTPFNIVPLIVIVILYSLIVRAADKHQKRKIICETIETKMTQKGSNNGNQGLMPQRNIINKSSVWKKKGILTLGVLIVTVTLLWLPLSIGMLVFVFQNDFT